MGAKLHPSSQLHRVYAPSTHSLPVIKCVAGIDGDAEVEIKSCNSGIARLRDLSPLYQRIWAGDNTAADKVTLKGVTKDSKRTFSVVCYPDVLHYKPSLKLIPLHSCTHRQMIP
jgi:polynucleotide 5'-hydroxyl-kinase GRC3/NOL9